MKLYEINAQLEELMLRLEPDPETGEIPEDEAQILADIDALELQRGDLLQYLAKMALNARAEASALKDEESRLKLRRSRLEARESRLLEILDRECGGVKTDLGVATLNYRKSTRMEVSDPDAAIAWLDENGYDECLRIKAPEISKSEVTKLLQLGVEVPGCEIVKASTYSLK